MYIDDLVKATLGSLPASAPAQRCARRRAASFVGRRNRAPFATAWWHSIGLSTRPSASLVYYDTPFLTTGMFGQLPHSVAPSAVREAGGRCPTLRRTRHIPWREQARALRVCAGWGLRSNGTENTLKRDRVKGCVALLLRASPAAALRTFGVVDIPHAESAPATQNDSDQESSNVHVPAATGEPHPHHRDVGLLHTGVK
jgi:hypothetical protein